MSNYQERLQQCYGGLSNGLRRVGDYLLRRPEMFAVNSASQVGEEVGVSETTVIRFAYALDYGGYSELQRDIRQHIFDVKSTLSTYQLGKQTFQSHERVFDKVMNQDRENILSACKHINPDDFDEAVNKLSGADRILTAGVRSSHAMAHWFTFVMEIIRGNTRMFQSGTDDIFLRLSEMGENSVFVAFSFHRYAVETIRLATEMAARGVCVIGVTDSPAAPIAKHASIVFPVQLAARSTLDAAPVCFSLLNALTSAVSLRHPERFERRLKDYEADHLTRFFE